MSNANENQTAQQPTTRIMESGECKKIVLESFDEIEKLLMAKLLPVNKHQRFLLKGRIIGTLFAAHFKPALVWAEAQMGQALTKEAEALAAEAKELIKQELADDATAEAPHESAKPL